MTGTVPSRKRARLLQTSRNERTRESEMYSSPQKKLERLNKQIMTPRTRKITRSARKDGKKLQAKANRNEGDLVNPEVLHSGGRREGVQAKLSYGDSLWLSK